jgi:cell division protease FtsH
MRVPWGPILLRTRSIQSVVPYSYIVHEIKHHQIEQATILPENNIFVRMVDGTTQNSIMPDTSVVNLLLDNDVPFAVEQKQPDVLGAVINTIGNLAFPILLLFSFLSSRQGPMPFDIGKSKSMVETKSTGVTFADVAGCDGSKLELQEVVDFLKNPQKYEAVGAKAPRGVLMEGPPGTGKTLLAKAVAGEAGVPFLSASGSEFVEMFVGVGASRVRDLFEKAKKNAPCIVFIDEIDAVAKKRGGASGGPRSGGNDEQEQTLNQILTEMDGFEGSSGVVVIAATNRADVLDAAILRPGRFDRRVPVDLPDRAGREAILKVHAKTRPLDYTVNLKSIASRTTGFSGASLANLLNEAAIVSARRNKTDISIQEVDYALDRLTVGIEKPMTMSQQKKELVAYHEAGHAIMGLLTPGFDKIAKVTIIPRSNAGGFTLFVPPEEEMFTKKYLESRIQVALGGRVAEELAFGMENITTGASSDLQSVASLARTMVTQWGFSEVLGQTAWEVPNSYTRIASEGTQELIDTEVQEIVEKAYNSCKQTLSSNWELVKKLVALLLIEETVNAETLLTFVE